MNRPAFKNSELGPIPADWEVKRLGEIAPLQRGFDLPTSALAHGTVPVVYSNGILNFHKTGLCDAPGLVTGRSGTIGKFTFIGRGTYWPHNTTLWVTSFCGNEPKFVYYLYSRIGFERFSGGTGVPTLNRNDLHAYQVAIPISVDEQRRIAAALFDADAWIESLDKLIEKKKLVKQGAMQALLSGKTRLPGFSGEWEERRLGEIGVFRKGSGISREEGRSGNIPAIRYGELYTHHDCIIRAFASHISEAVASRATLLKPGDILFACSGETKEEIGKCAAFVQPVRAYGGGDLLIMTPDAARCDSVFLGYALNTAECQIQKSAAGQGDAVVHIHKDALEEIAIRLPATLAEQTAIAAVLSDMDAELTSLSREKAKAEQIKQGMMQELLTGRTRLKG